MVRITLLLSLFVALAGCGEDFSVTDQPLQGDVGGVPWTFAQGDTSAFLSDEDFFTRLDGDTFEACGFNGPTEPYVLVSVPMEVGSYELSFSAGRTLTFVVDDGGQITNLIATEGVIRVDSVGADSFTAGIYARFDGDNEIDGVFTATICSDQP